MNNIATASIDASSARPQGRSRRRRLALIMLALTAIIAIVTYVFLAGGRIESTDDAAMLDGEISRQATMVAYLDAFRLMLGIALTCTPMLLLLKGAKASARNAVSASPAE